jgi:hypothetical protein
MNYCYLKYSNIYFSSNINKVIMKIYHKLNIINQANPFNEYYFISKTNNRT